jgi:hypothetical protein
VWGGGWGGRSAAKTRGTRRFPQVMPDFESCWFKSCGIPHLAKNERDMGHPLVGGGDRPRGVAQFVKTDSQAICWGAYNTERFGRIMRIVQDFRNSPGRRRFAFLLPLGLLMLSMAVFGWGLQYKLSLYQAKDSISHLTPEAKLLSQKERPVATQAMDVRPSELPAFPLLPALLMAALTPGLYQAAARYVRTASTEGSRAPLPPCLQAVFLRPPPVLS